MAAADTEVLLDRLDAVREARGALELFDALAAEQSGAVAELLAQHLRHPLCPEISQWLALRGVEVPQPPTAEDVATRLGITNLEAFLADEAKTRARLMASRE